MREKLIELLDKVHHTNMGKTYIERLGTIADHLIANGVKIPVMCKDCKYRYYHELDEVYYCNHGCGLADCVESDDFCPHGERKDDT